VYCSAEDRPAPAVKRHIAVTSDTADQLAGSRNSKSPRNLPCDISHIFLSNAPRPPRWPGRAMGAAARPTKRPLRQGDAAEFERHLDTHDSGRILTPIG
jgi:hypothetical protein